MPPPDGDGGIACPDRDGDRGDRTGPCGGGPLAAFDADGDGAISAAELDAGLAKQQADLLAKVDANADGAVSAEELAAIADDRLAGRLEAWDTDADGAVSAAELAAHLAAKKTAILERFDANGDGSIGADEMAAPPAPDGDTGDSDTTATPESLASSAPVFVRGDATNDGAVDIADAVRILSYLFLGGAQPACLKAADANDDGNVNISDTLGVLSTLFLGQGAIAAPYPVAGTDSTPDDLTCENS